MPARVTLQGWKRPSADLIVCVPYRIAIECLVLLLLGSCSLTFLSWRQTKACSPPHARAGVGRSPVAIVSVRTGLAWSVDEHGTVVMETRGMDDPSEPPSRQAFHLEWQQPVGSSDSYFCLRWLRDMRLVEVALPGAADEYMLRVGGSYGCDHSAAHFAFRGSSLFSLGVGSFVNVREDWHVRAHGDKGPPWKPLRDETRATQVSVEPLPDRRDYVERNLLELVRRFERNATRAAAPPT